MGLLYFKSLVYDLKKKQINLCFHFSVSEGTLVLVDDCLFTTLLGGMIAVQTSNVLEMTNS